MVSVDFRSFFVIGLELMVIVAPCAFAIEVTTQPPRASPTAAPVPQVPQTKEVYGPHDTLSPEEAKTLLTKFDAAIEMKRKAFLHRTELQRKEMLKTLESRKVKWAKDEDAKMAEYKRLNPNLKPDEYVNQTESRRKDFLKAMQEEQSAYDLAQKAKLEKLEKDLVWRKSEAKRIVEDGERPPRDLWP